MLQIEKIENYSGIQLNIHKDAVPLRKDYYEVLDIGVSGDAPKNFIRLYSSEEGVRKSNKKSWPRYIAKVGHKWYPIESINEFLLNKIGEELGLSMAKSLLATAGQQLRFLSRYFLKPNEILVHGAEIFSGHIYNKEQVDEIEGKGLARKIFTFQFAEAALINMFEEDSNHILNDFVKMLAFDAVTGNNDRHFYNWGIIKHVENKKGPVFSPIYDSARGLFWNDHESKLVNWTKDPKQLEQRIKKYAEGSKPKIGWNGYDDLNHFDLLNHLSSDVRFRNTCREVISHQNKLRIINLLKSDFSALYSKERLQVIIMCIEYRFDRLLSLI